MLFRSPCFAIAAVDCRIFARNRRRLRVVARNRGDVWIVFPQLPGRCPHVGHELTWILCVQRKNTGGHCQRIAWTLVVFQNEFSWHITIWKRDELRTESWRERPSQRRGGTAFLPPPEASPQWCRYFRDTNQPLCGPSLGPSMHIGSLAAL